MDEPIFILFNTHKSQLGIILQLAGECEAEIVLQVVVNSERMEASIEAVGSSALHRKHKINVRLFAI